MVRQWVGCYCYQSANWTNGTHDSSFHCAGLRCGRSPKFGGPFFVKVRTICISIMAGPELLVHISAPSRGVDDRRYKEQLRGLLDFEVLTRHDILTTKRPLSPNPLDDVNTKLTGRYILPLQPSKDDRSLSSQNLNPSRLPVKADLDGRRGPIKRGEYSRRKEQSIASVLERLHRNAHSPSIQIKRTPAPTKSIVQVSRTPAQLAKSKASTSINDHFKRIRKASHGDHHNSLETPPRFIPDSQPSARLQRCKMSDKSSPTLKASERHQVDALHSSQVQGINHSTAIDIVFESFQDVTNSQLSRSSAENVGDFEEDSGDSRSRADQDPHKLLESNVCADDHDLPLTSSQSRAGNVYPQHETYEEFLSGEKRLAPQPSSPHVRGIPPSSDQSQGAPLVSPEFNPTTRMIAYLTPTPAIRRGPLINQEAPTPYLLSLTAPNGPFPLSRSFEPNVLARSPLPTSSLLPSLIPPHGHWLIPLRLWPSSKQRIFWNNLKDRIESGDAGYPGAVTALIEDREGRTGSKRRGVDVVRVGCLVERMKDVWCLLWEASDGWVGRCGREARFRAWDRGEVKEVVRMR